MDFNEYYVEWAAHERLAAARAAARREALVPRHVSARPTLAARLAAFATHYLRWSSATSTGSKPTTARACSVSR